MKKIIPTFVVLVPLLFLGFLGFAQAKPKLAIKGYDLVSYHQAEEPLKGEKANELVYGGKRYRFVSAENKAAFEKNPANYLPAYGGYCAWAMADGKKAPVDPLIYQLVDGKLYLNYNAKILKKWQEDIPGFIAKADAQWSKIQAEEK